MLRSPHTIFQAEPASRVGLIPALGPMTEILVNIDVNDIAAAERFYCAALMLSPGRRFGADGVELLGASSRIYLLKNETGTRASPRSKDKRSYQRHWTPIHLDFVVGDLEAAVERSIAAGGAQEQPIGENSWGRIAVMSDPFGHGYCLIEFSAAGYDAIATPEVEPSDEALRG